MSKAPVPFANNWAYLKVELNWLERLLMLAVARKRKELKDINRVAHNRGDKVTSHWWKGLIHVSPRAYDEGPPQKSAQQSTDKATADKALGYQRQLELRIRASRAQNIALALPELRSQLRLSLFEKNALLMALAPEVNLNYSRLYHFLQTGEENQRGTLPTVDLMLRLLCRNEAERRLAMTLLSSPKSLIQRRVLRQVTPEPHTLLGSYLQVTPDWARYLIADHPQTIPPLNELGNAPSSSGLALTAVSAVASEALVVPDTTRQLLQTLALQTETALEQGTSHPQGSGLIALFIGEASTGKTTAAGTLVHGLSQPIYCLDLDQQPADQWPSLLQQLTAERYPRLLIRRAHRWLGRRTDLDLTALQAWWLQRTAAPALTIFTAHYSHTVSARWRQQFDVTLEFCQPDTDQRRRLWQQALPRGLKAARSHHWQRLAQIPLTGDQLQRIAKAALALDDKPTLAQLQQALKQHGHQTPIKKTDRSGP